LKGYISFPVLSAQERKISRPGIKPGIKPGRTQRRKPSRLGFLVYDLMPLLAVFSSVSG